MMDKKPRVADAMSIAEICDQLTAENGQLKARLAGIVEAICGDIELRLSERQRSRIRALAPAVAEITQPADGVVVPRPTEIKPVGKHSLQFIYLGDMTREDVLDLLAAAQEPR